MYASVSYNTDVVVICEMHFKKKHADSCFDIDGYALFRRDRLARKGGGVAIFVRSSLPAAKWSTIVLDRVYELLWVKVDRGYDVTFVGALYHPPAPLYRTSDIVDHVVAAVIGIQQDFPDSHITPAGDLNSLSDSEIVIRTDMTSIVSQPMRGDNKLDRVYVSDLQYSGVKVVKSAVRSDHQAIIAYSGGVVTTRDKTRRVVSSGNTLHHNTHASCQV